MIDAEDQRRWWFATHPEYSSGRRGIRTSEREKNDNRIDPKEVDKYVDRALKYENGPVADLLKSVKKNFGTEGDSQKGGQSSGTSAVRSQDSSVSLTGYYADGGAFMPRLPTTEELSQWPEKMVRQFFRALDTILQNNPLIIDPNALERHHGLPREFINYFLDCGLKIDQFMMIMRAADHRLKPDGLHTGKGRGGDWNTDWKQFIREYPAQNTPEHQRRVMDKFEEMKKKYGIR